MTHPLYPHAMRMVGQYVHVHHLNGRVYPGFLQSVTRTGIYLMSYQSGARLVHSTETSSTLNHTYLQNTSNADLEQVYSPAAYFGFGALAGLTLGAMASPYVW